MFRLTMSPILVLSALEAYHGVEYPHVTSLLWAIWSNVCTALRSMDHQINVPPIAYQSVRRIISSH